jgi:RNA polymerase sigma-70 factor (ECF subfamily)
MGDYSTRTSHALAVTDDDAAHIDNFVRLLTTAQRPLFSYILSLVGNNGHASDIFQSTNEVLWRKRSEFAPGTNFAAWARRVAYWEVMDFYKRRKGDRHLFDADLLTEMAAVIEETATAADSRLAHLDDCLDALPPRQREVILQRYDVGVSIADLAQSLGRTTTATTQLLYRIRLQLMDCVEAKLAAGGYT